MVEWKYVLRNLGLLWPLGLNKMADCQRIIIMLRLSLDFREVDSMGLDLPDQTSDQVVLQGWALRWERQP